MGCRKKCNDYCVNDGPKLALIIVWFLATVAVFVERYVGTNWPFGRTVCRQPLCFSWVLLPRVTNAA